MRAYEIKITDQDGNPKVVKDPKTGAVLFNGTWSSFQGNKSSGTYNLNALHCEFDLPVSVIGSPLGGAYFRIYGVGLPLLGQSSNFNPSIDYSTYCNIVISAGMAGGLPLANPKQYGQIMAAQITQSLGNWQGTSQTLDLIMNAPLGSSQNPRNLQFQCNIGSSFSEAIKNSLSNGFKGIKVNVNISDKLIAPETITQSNVDLTSLSKFLSEKSISILGNLYSGVKISFQNGEINVYDDTYIASSSPISIQFQDLIGQPTWIGTKTLVFKTVMRFDLKVGGAITMPIKSQQLGQVLQIASAGTQYKNQSDFQGNFQIQMVRQIGSFRSPDANNWVTVIQAYMI